MVLYFLIVAFEQNLKLNIDKERLKTTSTILSTVNSAVICGHYCYLDNRVQANTA